MTGTRWPSRILQVCKVLEISGWFFFFPFLWHIKGTVQHGYHDYIKDEWTKCHPASDGVFHPCMLDIVGWHTPGYLGSWLWDVLTCSNCKEWVYIRKSQFVACPGHMLSGRRGSGIVCACIKLKSQRQKAVTEGVIMKLLAVIKGT